MKNLFLVVNKEKIYAYVVSIMTIVVIFFMSSMLNSDLEDTETTSSNSMKNVQTVETDAQISQNTTDENGGTIGEAVSTSTPSIVETETETEENSKAVLTDN